VKREVSDELRFHLEERIDELVAAGMSRAAAEREARARFGDFPSIGAMVEKIDYRMARKRTLGDTFEALWRDIRFGARALAKSPGFTVVAVLTLGLAIGANTAIFSAVNRVLLHPLKVPLLDRIYMVYQNMPGLNLVKGPLTPSEAETLAARKDLFEVFAGIDEPEFTLTGAGEPQRLAGAQTMGRFFDLFSLTPAVGHFYHAEDSQNGNTRVAVLSNSFWRTWAGGDPGVVGRSIELSGQTYQVIGVMPAGFGYRQGTQVYVPLEITQRMREQSPWMITALARVRGGETTEQFNAGMARLTAEFTKDPAKAPSPEYHFSFSGEPLTDRLAGDLKPLLMLLMVAVSLVLLIACANVANLQLVRGAGRAREMAVRAAMGAGRWPIMRQLIVENALLAGAGGALGLGLGYLAIRSLRGMQATQFPALRDLHLDGPVLGFAAAVTMLAVLFFGIAPTLRAGRTSVSGILRDAARGSSAGSGRNRLLRVSAATQVALSLMLLLGAGLLIRSLSLLLGIDPGFKASHVLTFSLALPSATYREGSQKAGFFEDITARIAALPGIESVGAISDLPFGGGENSSTFTIVGKPVDPGQPERHADMRFVQGDYFKTLGIPLIRGRWFGPEDHNGSAMVSVIDESLARQYFGTEDPVGKALNQGPTSTIIGVVGTVKHNQLDESDLPVIYYTYSQAPWYSTLYLTVRTQQDAPSLMQLAKAKVAEIDKNLPVYDVSPLQQRVDKTLGTRRLAMAVLSVFAVVALLLALLGVYGVLSYSTSRRAHELGIRMALGAVPGDLIRMVLGSGLALTLVGLAVGLAGFLVLARLLSTVLYGVTPRDPVTIVAGVAVLASGAILAAYIPARRAARVDPVEALREE
jgi:putative ABC transport system permease protein